MSPHHNDPSDYNPQFPPDAETNRQGNLEHEILLRAGCLRGFRVDGVDEPRISALKVASYVNGATPSIEDSDTSNLLTDIIISKNEREMNYSHRGWSLDAAREISPWTSSRIAAKNRPTWNGTWYTRITKTKRIRMEIQLEDLAPTPEFEAAIEVALGHPTTFEKFQAVYRVLNRWGDVIPLETEIGSSIALSSGHLDRVQSSDINERGFGSLSQFSTIKNIIVAITGADLNLTYDQWATTNDSAFNPQWQRIAVTKVAPTINLLSGRLQARLSELYALRLCHVPRDGVGPVNESYRTYDDNQHASKMISSIKLRCSHFIEVLSITYSDGGAKTNHGGGGNVGAEYEFALAAGEYITEMLIWNCGEWLHGLQFVTSTGRCSDQYGIHWGIPRVARCKGGILVGFLSHTKLHPNYKEMYHDVQGIWRRDLVPRVPKEEDVYSDYFGDTGKNGQAFNERALVGNSTSIHISSVEIGSGEFIDSIRLNYTDVVDGIQRKASTMRRGKHGGPYNQFTLEDGEHIVTISGRNEASCITQLCFGTNRGRTSEVFGAGRGQSFSALAPRDQDGNYFRLQYICGKSNVTSLTGVMFVWTPC